MYKVLYRDTGILIEGTREYGFWSIHCKITRNFTSHWRNKQNILNILPYPAYAIQPDSRKKLKKFLILLGSRKINKCQRGNELATIWELPRGNKFTTK